MHVRTQINKLNFWSVSVNKGLHRSSSGSSSRDVLCHFYMAAGASRKPFPSGTLRSECYFVG